MLKNVEGQNVDQQSYQVSDETTENRQFELVLRHFLARSVLYNLGVNQVHLQSKVDSGKNQPHQEPDALGRESEDPVDGEKPNHGYFLDHNQHRDDEEDAIG